MFSAKHSFLLFFLLVCYWSHAQELQMLASLPPVLKGCSGIEMTANGDLLMVNDHGNPVIYFVDTDSFKVKKTIYLNNKIRDWEDLTTDDENNVYIGDFGNNRNNRRDLKVYKIGGVSDSSKQIMTAKIINFTLSDQKKFPPESGAHEFDIEAMVYYNHYLYLFSKSRGRPFKGLVKLYRLNTEPGDQVAELMDSTYLGNANKYESWITGADLKDDKLVLLTHGKIFLFNCIENDTFFTSKAQTIDLKHFSQKEAICFDPTEGKLLITDELTQGILGGNIYSLQMSQVIGECK